MKIKLTLGELEAMVLGARKAKDDGVKILATTLLTATGPERHKIGLEIILT